MSRNQDKVAQDDSSSWVRDQARSVLAAESLRSGVAPAEPAAPASRAEDRMSAFWRICGGTVLSILALVVITVFQTQSNNIHELRTNLDHLKEQNGELVKKEEFNNRIGRLGDYLKEFTLTVPALKAQASAQEIQLRDAEKERKELCKEVQALRERLASLEGHHAAGKASAAGKDDHSGK